LAAGLLLGIVCGVVKIIDSKLKATPSKKE
jgi:hypothetical protein